MVRAKALVNERGQIVFYESEGHAGKDFPSDSPQASSNKANKNRDNRERLAVCNAISILEYQFLFGIKEIFGNELVEESSIRPGYFKLILDLKNNQIDNQDKTGSDFDKNVSLLSKYFLIGIQLIERKNPQHLELTIKDN